MLGRWSTPAFVSQTNFTGVAAGTGFTIATPAGVQVGDYMLLFLVTNKDTITPDPAFTLVRQDLDSANQWSMAVYSRVATSTDAAGTTYTWSCSLTTNAPNTAVLLAYRGVDSANVVFQHAYTALTTNPVTTPSVSTTTPALILTGDGCRNGAGATIKTFTGSGNERFDGGNHGATTSYMQAYYDSGTPSTTIGSNTGNSITISDTTNLTDRMSYTVALGAQWLPPTAPANVIQQQAWMTSTW